VNDLGSREILPTTCQRVQQRLVNQEPPTKPQAAAESKAEARKAAKPGVAPKATPTPGGDAATAAGSTMPVETKAQKAAEAKKAKRKVKKAPGPGQDTT